MISDRFRNIDIMQEVTCPAFFLHGQQDTLISPFHSQALSSKVSGPNCLVMPADMDHNKFDFENDLLFPCT